MDNLTYLGLVPGSPQTQSRCWGGRNARILLLSSLGNLLRIEAYGEDTADYGKFSGADPDSMGSEWFRLIRILLNIYRPFIIRAYCTVQCTVNQGGFGSAPNILRIFNLVYIDTYSIRKKNRARRKKRCLTRIILTFFLSNILPSSQKWCTKDI